MLAADNKHQIEVVTLIEIGCMFCMDIQYFKLNIYLIFFFFDLHFLS